MLARLAVLVVLSVAPLKENDLPSRRIDIISTYWNKIAKMFSETKPKEGLLMRAALLALGDYTMTIHNNYKT